jgi:hypothetical protein
MEGAEVSLLHAQDRRERQRWAMGADPADVGVEADS